jgi:hypothetical protein
MGAPSGRAAVLARFVTSGFERVLAFVTVLGVVSGARVGNKLAALPETWLWVGATGWMPGKLVTGSGTVPMTGAGTDRAGTDGAADVAGEPAGVFGVVVPPAVPAAGLVCVREPVGVAVGAGVEDLVEVGDPLGVEDARGEGDPEEVGVPVEVGELVGVVVGVADAGGCGAVTATVAEATASVATLAALAVAARVTEVTVVAVTGTVSCAWSCRGVDCASSVPRVHDDVPLPQPTLNNGVPPFTGVALSETTALVAFAPVVQAVTVHWDTWPRTLLACPGTTSTHKVLAAAVDDPEAVPAVVPVPVAVAVPVAGAGVDGLAFAVDDGAVVGELVGVGGAVSGSHAVPLVVVPPVVVAALASARPAAAAKATPEAAVTRTAPVMSVTVAGPACAKRMKRPISAVRYCYGTIGSVQVLAS